MGATISKRTADDCEESIDKEERAQPINCGRAEQPEELR